MKFIVMFLLLATTVTLGDELDELSRMQQRVQSLKANGNYREAIPLAREVVERAEALFADKPALIATSLTYLAILYDEQRNYSEAEPIYQRALKINERLGADHPNVAASLSNLVELYRKRSKYAEAEPLCERLLKIHERSLGPDHPKVAITLTSLGDLYDSQSKYAEAEPLLQRALEIREKSRGRDSLDVAMGLTNLAILYEHRGKYVEGEMLHQRALRIREKSLGADHPDVAASLQGLAGIYRLQGKYTDAEPLLRRALQIFERSLGPDSPEIAETAQNLGLLYYEKSEYAAAEPLYRRALTIAEKYHGPDHAYVATIISNLAEVYRYQLKYTEAEQLHRRALKIKEKVYGSDRPNFASSLNYLANLYGQQGKYAEAEPLLRQALMVYEKSLGSNTPEFADTLNNLALLYQRQSNFAEAEPLHQQALKIYEGSLGPDHSRFAASLHNLASLYEGWGKYTSAEPLINRAIAIDERVGVGPDHRNYCYMVRSRIAWALRNRTAAIADLHHALDLAEQQRVQFSGAEQDRAQGFESFLHCFEQMVAWQHELGSEGIPGEVVSAIERSRARSLLDDLNLAGMDLDQGRSSEERERLRQNEARIKSSAAQLEKQYENAKSPEEREKLLPELAKAREAVYLEYRDRRASSPVYRQLLSAGGQPIRLEQLQQTLATDQALLLVYFLGEKAGYVLTIQANHVQLTTLKVNEASAKTLRCDAGPLTLKRVQRILMNDQKTGVLQKLSEPATAEQATAQLAALWQVLIPEVQREQLQSGDLKQLMIVPDGPLSCLPFEALVVSDDSSPSYLLDVGPPILYAPSATILFNLATRKSQPTPDKLQPVLSVADATYSSFTTAAARGSGSALDELTPRSRYGSLGGHLAPLPYTATESDWIKESFTNQGTPVGRLLKDDATELNVRFNIPGRKIVHLACHGLADQAYGNFFGALALTPGQRASGDLANDGFLTLAEINQLDLKSCELAILSACETNYGPQQKGEGTWALSRGFLVAGAKRVVASNWLVDDEAAASLIYYFCSGLNQADNESLDHARALQTAKRLIRKQDRWKSPYYWATFVLVGPN